MPGLRKIFHNPGIICVPFLWTGKKEGLLKNGVLS